MQALSPVRVSNEDVRAATANLTEFFSILLEWDGAKASSDPATEEDPQCIVKARSIEPEP